MPQWEMKAAHVVFLLAALIRATTCLFFRRHIFVSTYLTWTDAQTYCRENYVDLSTIDSEEEHKRFTLDIADHLSTRSWIGLHKTPDQTTFGPWSDGSIFRFASWKSAQPDDPSNQCCVSIASAEFADFFCTALLPFICYTWQPTLIMVQELKTWHGALIHCRTQYTDLISLSTEIDFLQVNKITGNFQNVSVWTGLTFLDGSWIWVNNDPLENAVSLSSCPIQPFRCGAKVDVDILAIRDCMEEMNFICYQIWGYVCQLLRSDSLNIRKQSNNLEYTVGNYRLFMIEYSLTNYII